MRCVSSDADDETATRQKIDSKEPKTKSDDATFSAMEFANSEKAEMIRL